MAPQPSLRERILKGPLLLGPGITSLSPSVVEVAGLSGCDFVWIEMEHGSMDLMQLESMCRAAELRNTIPLARIQDGTRTSVLRALEAGARILVVPQIHTPEQAAAVVEYGKFPPLGERGYNLGSRGLAYGFLAPTPDEVMAAANAETCLIVQIESVEAVENAEAIAAVPGVDGLFVGPGDLSMSMGVPSQWDNEGLLSAGERVIALAREQGLVSASTCPTDDMTRRWIAAGVNMLVFGGDLASMRKGLQDRMTLVRGL